MMLHARGWTAVVLISLALGIGANTALFSAINGLWLKKLLVRDPDTLVRFRSVGPNEMRTDTLVFYGFTAPDARGRHVDRPEVRHASTRWWRFAANSQRGIPIATSAPHVRTRYHTSFIQARRLPSGITRAELQRLPYTRSHGT